jgi:hypothetical protein
MEMWKVAFEPDTQNGTDLVVPISVPASSALEDESVEQIICNALAE